MKFISHHKLKTNVHLLTQNNMLMVKFCDTKITSSCPIRVFTTFVALALRSKVDTKMLIFFSSHSIPPSLTMPESMYRLRENRFNVWFPHWIVD